MSPPTSEVTNNDVQTPRELSTPNVDKVWITNLASRKPGAIQMAGCQSAGYLIELRLVSGFTCVCHGAVAGQIADQAVAVAPAREQFPRFAQGTQNLQRQVVLSVTAWMHA